MTMDKSEQRLTDVLDECLRLVAEGATVEVCLSRYPEHVDELRQLLELAVAVRRVPIPTANPEAAAAGKQRMLQALAEKARSEGQELPQQGVVSRVKVWASELIDGLLPRGQAGLVPAFRVAASAAGALAVILVGTLLFNSWLGVTVPRKAEVAALSGEVEVRHTAEAAWTAAEAGERLGPGAEIRAGGGGTAELAFFDGSTVALEGGTQLALEQMAARRSGSERVIVIHQESGRTDYVVQPLPDAESRFEVRTLTAVAMVRGTAFAVSVESDGTTQVAVWTGLVEVVGADSSVSLMPGWATNVRPNLPPAEPVVVPTPEPMEAFAALPTLAPTATATWTATPLPPPTLAPAALGPTVAPTDTPAPSATVEPTATPEPEQEREEPTATPVAPTATPVPPTATPVPTATQEPEPLKTPTAIPTEPPVPTDTPEPVRTPTPIPTEPPVPTETPAPVDPPTPIPTEPSA